MIYLLSPTTYNGVENIPMIEFETIAAKIDLENIDLLLFTSKQAVIMADTIDKKWRNIQSIAIGDGTKKEIENRLGVVTFIANKFYGEALAKDIIENFSDKRILYLRPEIISTDITRILLNAKINIREQIIYKTKCKKYDISQKPPLNSIIIATSPSTLNCFIQNFGWDNSYYGVAIGKTTANSFSCNMNFVISDAQTINSCIIKANEIENIV